MSKKIDLAGETFGRLTVRAQTSNAGKHVRWVCDCECGSQTVVSTSHLRSGHSLSCGCLAREATAQRNTAAATHGMSDSPEYQAWRSMIKRCHVPSTHGYERYGGRGIEVCQAWRDSFEDFFKEVGFRPSPSHSLDRIRNAEGYCAGNVRWATDTEQNNNRRCNVKASIEGRVLTATQIAKRFGLSQRVVLYRIHTGKTEAQIIAPSRRSQ